MTHILRIGKNTALSIAVILTVISGILSGCSKKTPTLIETIPADATFAATVDLDCILKNAGCKFNNGEITLSDDLMTIRNSVSATTAGTIDILTATAPTVDISRVMIFGDCRNNIILTFSITDSNLFENIIASTDAEKSTLDDLTVYKFNGLEIVTDGNQGWIAEHSENVTAALKSAAVSNFGQHSATVDFIRYSTDAITAAVNLESASHLTGNGSLQNRDYSWMFMSTKLTDSSLGIEVTFTDSKGRQADFTPYISAIDTDFLNYIPDNAQATAAIGQIKNLDEMFGIITPALPSDIRGNLGMVIPYLKAIDGTMAVAANPAAGGVSLKSISPDTWDFTLMAHMPQSSIDALSSLIALSARGNIKPSDDGQQSITLYGMDINYGSYDGYFIASTRNISTGYSSPLANAFNGKLAAMVIDIPYNSATMKAFNLPYGVYFTAGIGSKSVNARFKFNGTGEPLLTTVASIAARNIKSSSSSDDYEIVSIREVTVNDDFIPDNLEPVDEI